MHMLRGTDNCFSEFYENKSTIFVKKKKKKRKERKLRRMDRKYYTHFIISMDFFLISKSRGLIRIRTSQNIKFRKSNTNYW